MMMEGKMAKHKPFHYCIIVKRTVISFLWAQNDSENKDFSTHLLAYCLDVCVHKCYVLGEPLQK